MAVTVWIPTQLRAITGGQGRLEAAGPTVDDVLLDLERRFPGLKERLLDDHGEVRAYLAIYVNDEDIRFLDALGTAVADGDEVEIVPAVAGGRGR